MKTNPNTFRQGLSSVQDSSEPKASIKLLDSTATRTLFGNRSDMWLWRRIKDGTLPKPLLISGRRYWRADEIDKLITQLSDERAGT